MGGRACAAPDDADRGAGGVSAACDQPWYIGDRRYGETLVTMRQCRAPARYRVTIAQDVVAGRGSGIPFRDRVRARQNTVVYACTRCCGSIAHLSTIAERALEKHGIWTETRIPGYPLVIVVLGGAADVDTGA